MEQDNIRLTPQGVEIIDQTLLPSSRVWITLSDRAHMYEAIAKLRVRGAPAIGICGAYCLCFLSRRYVEGEMAGFLAHLSRDAAYLNASRPTAVNLSWALGRMERVAAAACSVAEARDLLEKECVNIHKEDMETCLAISRHGLSLLQDGQGILTHCNAGPLATSRYGTALGPILLGREKGMAFHVYADETRPLLQGARLTSYELQQAGVDVTLICDNMAASVMAQGWVQACLVGCDRVAANGDTANKIGTYGVAVLAKHFGIPFYVLGPTSTIDLCCKSGADIPIELRDGAEIHTLHYARPMAPQGINCYNPAFDVTPAELITAIVTEKGILRPPYTESIRRAKVE